MTWNDLIDRIHNAGLQATEDFYMEHYGSVLAIQRPEFHGRHFRCAHGVIQCDGLRVEAFLFPSEGQLQDFLEVVGPDPWWISKDNVALHFPQPDTAKAATVAEAVFG